MMSNDLYTDTLTSNPLTGTTNSFHWFTPAHHHKIHKYLHIKEHNTKHKQRFVTSHMCKQKDIHHHALGECKGGNFLYFVLNNFDIRSAKYMHNDSTVLSNASWTGEGDNIASVPAQSLSMWNEIKYA